MLRIWTVSNDSKGAPLGNSEKALPPDHFAKAALRGVPRTASQHPVGHRPPRSGSDARTRIACKRCTFQANRRYVRRTRPLRGTMHMGMPMRTFIILRKVPSRRRNHSENQWLGAPLRSHRIPQLPEVLLWRIDRTADVFRSALQESLVKHAVYGDLSVQGATPRDTRSRLRETKKSLKIIKNYYPQAPSRKVLRKGPAIPEHVKHNRLET